MLAKVEFDLKSWINKTHDNSIKNYQPDTGSLREKYNETRIAHFYRQYIKIAQENDIKLVICNFNMAVNEKSPENVVLFYEAGFPDVRSAIIANRINSIIVEEISKNSSGLFVDTHSNLNGAYEDCFLDLVHLTHQGKKIIADNIYNGIKPIIEKDIVDNIQNNDGMPL